MKSQDINNLLYSPQWTEKLLHYYLSGAYDSNNQKLKFELIYFALPLIYDEIVIEKLTNSNKASSLTTIFKTPELRNRLASIDSRIEAFRDITNQGLIYLGNNLELTINRFIQIDEKIHYSQEEIPLIRYFSKGAFNLGHIIAKEDYKNIFTKLEILNI